MGRSDGNSKRSRSPRRARPCGSSSTQAPGPNLAAAVRGQRSDPVLSRLKRTLRHSKVERPAGHLQTQTLWLQSLEASPGDLAQKRRKGPWRGRGAERGGCGHSGPVSTPLCPPGLSPQPWPLWSLVPGLFPPQQPRAKATGVSHLSRGGCQTWGAARGAGAGSTGAAHSRGPGLPGDSVWQGLSRGPRSWLLPGGGPPLPHWEPVQGHVRNLARQVHAGRRAQRPQSPAFSPGPLAASGVPGSWGALPRPPQRPTPTVPGSQSRQDRKELGLLGKAEGVRTAGTLSSPERPAPQGAPGGLLAPAPQPPSLPDAWGSWHQLDAPTFLSLRLPTKRGGGRGPRQPHQLAVPDPTPHGALRGPFPRPTGRHPAPAACGVQPVILTQPGGGHQGGDVCRSGGQGAPSATRKSSSRG